jgi:alpha-tubulin suppressor-like RCC1 family protein
MENLIMKTYISAAVRVYLVIVLALIFPTASYAATPAVTAGTSHTILLKADGTLWGWGDNTSGQLGLGTPGPWTEPTRIGISTWSSVSAGRNHTIAINSGGTLWFWGDSPAPPQQLSSSTTWESVSAGPDFNMAIKSDGSLWTWGGLNSFGQSGLGTAPSGTPITLRQVGTDTNWAFVSTGEEHCLALKKDGSLWAWGRNIDGRLGDGTTANKLVPTRIGADSSWVSIVAATVFSFGIKSDGSLWFWGNIGTPAPHVPTQFTNTSTGWAQLMPGGWAGHVLVLRQDGTLCAWGNNTNGQLGNNSTLPNSNFQTINLATNWAAAAAGGSHTVALKLNGAVFSWGGNTSGQLGYWTDSFTNSGNQLTPRLVTPHKLAGGDSHSLAVAPNGTLWAWGSNNSQQLGLGWSVPNAFIPTQLGSDTDWVAVAAGGRYSLALKTDGTLWEWGLQTDYRDIPTKIGIDNDWVDIAVGGSHALALKSNGNMYGWGYNYTGQIGDGTTQAKLFPVLVGSSRLDSGQTWLEIAAGSNFSGAIRSDGAFCTWGDNSSGQSGEGGAAGGYSTWPTCIYHPANTSWQSITAGAGHMLASKRYNDTYYNYVDGWGLNNNGQLGMGPVNPYVYPQVLDPTLSPINIDFFGNSAGKVYVKSGANANHSFALHQNGSMWGWGDSMYGQVGTLYNPEYAAPVAGTWATVAVGSDHSLGQLTDGTLMAWGSNTVYQLGTNPGNKSIPTGITTITPNISVTFTSNNSNTAWAKIGDVVTLSITSSNVSIPRPAARIAGHIVPVSGSGQSWSASYTITVSDADGVIPVSVRYTDSFSGASYPEITQLSINPDVTIDKTTPAVDARYLNSTVTESDNSIVTTNPLNQYNLSLSGYTADSAQISCTWSQISGTGTISFNNPNSCTPSARSTADGSYVLRLTATDQAGNSATSNLNVKWDSTPPTFSTVQISSNDSYNSLYAKEGDTITLNFTTSEPIQQPTVYIGGLYFGQGNLVTATGSVTSWSAQITLSSSGIINKIGEGQVNFFISILDLAGNPATNSTITTGSNITLDTIKPKTTYVSIASTNANPVYAKAGDTINLTIMPSETVLTPVVTIAGHTVVPTVRALGGWTASYVMTALDTEGSVVFSVAPVIDPAGNVSTNSIITWTTDVSSVTFDRTAPVVAFTTPLDQSSIEVLTGISGTASDATGSGIKLVELQLIQNGAGVCFYPYLNVMTSGIESTCPQWFTAAGTSTWNTSNIGLFSNVIQLMPSNADYTITVRVTDQAGNSTSVTSGFRKVVTLVAYNSTLTMDLPSNYVPINSYITVGGKLNRPCQINNYCDPINLQARKILLTVKKDNVEVTGAPIYSPITVLTSSSDGSYTSPQIGPFGTGGDYTIQASYAGAGTPGASGDLQSVGTVSKPFMVGSPAGYAVIIEGKMADNSGLASHTKSTHRIYKTLKERFFTDDNIYWFNHQQVTIPGNIPPMPVDDTVPTLTKVGDIISGTAIYANGNGNGKTLAELMNENPAPLYLMMVDHGDPQAFHLSGSEIITPNNINDWLATLDSKLTNLDAKAKKKIIIIGACYSGSFIKPAPGSGQITISAPGRVVITSASAVEQSYQGGYDGQDSVRSGEYFLDELFVGLKRKKTLRSAFSEATEKTWNYTRKTVLSLTNGTSPAFNAMQHPQLDDNGDGTGTIYPTDSITGDGTISSSLYLGSAPSGIPGVNSITDPADLKEVADTIYLDENATVLPAGQPLWATALDNSQVSSVWVELVRPSISLIATGGSGQLERPIDPLDRQAMDKTSTRYEYNKANPPDPLYPNKGPNRIDSSGKYEAYYYAIDVQTGNPSPSKRTAIYKDSLANKNFPTAPVLVEPGSDHSIPNPVANVPVDPNYKTRIAPSTIIFFQWQKSTDRDGDAITYRLEICPPSPATCIVRDEIIESSYLAGPEVGLQVGVQYTWKIVAVDAYGKRTSSEIRSFTPIAPNADAVYVSGTVFDAVTSLPIRASLTISKDGDADYPSRVAVADVDGAYQLPNLGSGGNYTLTADNSADGYAPVSIPVAITLQGAMTLFDQNVAMAKGSTTHTVNVTVTGNGTVTSSPPGAGGISCRQSPTNGCNATFDHSLATLSLLTLADGGSIFSNWTGACVGYGTCSFTDLNADKIVGATFIATPPFFIYSANPLPVNYFSDLQLAYSGAVNGDIIQMQATASVTGSAAIPATAKTLTLKGGYDADFNQSPSATSFTTISGKMTVKNGTLRVERVKVK